MEYQKNVGWYEIFLMVAGSVPNADLFFHFFLKKQKTIFNSLKSIKQIRDRLPKTKKHTPIQRALAITLMTFYANIGIYKTEIENIHKIISDLINKVTREDGEGDQKDLNKIKSTCIKIGAKVKKLPLPRENLLKSRYIEGYLDSIQRSLNSKEEVFNCLKTAGLINNLVIQIQTCLFEIEKRRPVSRKKTDLKIEKISVVEILMKLQNEIESVLLSFKELEGQLGIDLTNWKKISPLNQETIGHLQEYLYLNLLFIECLNVSAVTDRQALLNKSFLQ